MWALSRLQCSTGTVVYWYENNYFSYAINTVKGHYQRKENNIEFFKNIFIFIFYNTVSTGSHGQD
jgi:hypothetical protein